MPPDDLRTAQRGQSGGEHARLTFVASAIVAAALLLAMVASLWVAVIDDPDGGRPVAIATIADVPSTTGSVNAPPGAATAPNPLDAGATDAETTLAALPRPAPSADAVQGLLEPSSFGPLPRVGPGGRRPRDVYARPAGPPDPAVPRVAVVVGGMGLSQTGTRNAIEQLPEDITLAFAPYGASLQRWVDKARGEGHEVVLQAPMEPAGYPQENPGAHTLLVSADRKTLQQDLHWVLGRMTSYAGVMNYRGERFTGERQAFLPFLGEVGERGLYYIDDGSSPASLAASAGESLQVPVLTADALVDRKRSPEAIIGQLETLEAVARERGVAVGIASAFPESVEAIARWAREAQARGIAIVPASAALRR